MIDILRKIDSIDKNINIAKSDVNSGKLNINIDKLNSIGELVDKDRELEFNSNGELVMNSYNINKEVNKYRDSSKIRGEQTYGNFVKTIDRYIHHFEALGIEREKSKIDSYSRWVYLLNKDCLNLLINLTYNSDKAPLQKCYELVGGNNRVINTVNRFEDEFMRDLYEVLDVIGFKLEREVEISKYRVDGIIRTLKLIIEYDDSYHFTEKQRNLDKCRDEEIYKLGYNVLRLDYRNTNAVNVGLVIKEIFNK